MDLFDHADSSSAADAQSTTSPAPEGRRAGPLPIRRSFSLAPHLTPPQPTALATKPVNRAAPLVPAFARPVPPAPVPPAPVRASAAAMRPVQPPRATAQTVAALPPSDDSVEVRGKVSRVIYTAAESGYTVLSARFEGGTGEASLQVTTSVKVTIGDRIVARGKWATYKGKPQFKADMLQLEIPREAKGIADWLRNGSVQGVGRGSVAKLVAFFGEELPNVIDNAERLAEAGIGETRARAIAKAWSCNAEQPELTALLLGVGLKPKQVAKVIEHYGASAKKVIETNPWELVETIDGIGFPSADRIASLKMLNMTGTHRIQAGLAWVLLECLNRDGHCGMPEPELMVQAASMLDVPHEVIELEMPLFLDGVRTVKDEETGLVYARLLWEAECDLADNLAERMLERQNMISATEAEAAILRAEAELGEYLDRDGGQLEAAIMALSNGVCVITGGPGTGKSTTQRVIVKAFSYFEKKVALVAPTGRAAKRLSETSGEEALTIHRKLCFNPTLGEFVFNADNPLKVDVVIVDESSMVDLRLFASLAAALPPHAALILVGDSDQLPSVGPGQVLRDLIASETIPVTCLTRVHRQAAGSGIAVAAQRIKEGLPPVEEGGEVGGFEVTDATDAEAIEEVVRYIRFVLPEMGFDPMRDVQVLASMRKGEIGVPFLNDAIKAALNPALEDDENTVSLMGRPFTVGDRVMQTRNDYNKGVYNGEVGTVIETGQAVDEEGRRSSFVKVDYSGIEARYRADEVDDIELAYAATVHKSQGCEFPVVIFVAPRGHRRMLNRNLLYTGITRAKTECFVIGDQSVVDGAVLVADGFRRHTGLQQRLRAATAPYVLTAQPALWAASA